ncbi:MAG: SusC/RagA family TonB-linked outer membrane protein [Cyclobacteriaceae bacterium]
MLKFLLDKVHKQSVIQKITAVLFVFMACTSAMAQYTVSGKITSGEDQSTLPGVNILVKGTTNGTISDADGNFSINANSANDVLVFSFVGFTTQEVGINNRTSFDVTLGSDAKQLSEVVVTALGVKKELRTIGYTTQEVKGQDLVKAREPNPLNSLTGKVAGLNVGISSEMLGRPQLVLRGNSNLLFVVDGVPINSDTWNISADDIESYTVLKGPNAAALYGFRGQNGAILITTKRGSKDKRGYSIEFNSSTMVDKGFIAVPLSQDEYGAGANYDYAFGNKPYDEDGKFRRPNVWGPRFEGQNIPQYDSPIDPTTGIRTGTPYTARGKDNYNRFAETGILSTNNISFASSNDKADLRISVSHSHQKGIFPNTKLNITNFNISAGYNFSPKVRFEGNMNLSRQYTPNIPDVSYGPNSYTYMFSVYGGAQYDVADLKDYWQSPGKLGTQQYFMEYGRNNNPYFMANEWLRGHYKTDIYGYAKVIYKINDHWDVSLRTQATTWSALRTEKLPYSAIIYGRDLRQGDYREDRRNLFESNTDLLVKFDKKDVLPNFHINALFGANVRSFQYNSTYESTDYLIVPGVYNLSNSKNPKLSYNFRSDMLVLSAYGSIDLSYKNFVTLSATGREDKLSTLPVNNQSYFYPSLSLSSVVTDYVNLPEFLSFLKVRGSYANVKGGLTSSEVGPSYRAMNLTSPLQYGGEWNTSYDGPNYSNQNGYQIKTLYNNVPSADFSGNIANDQLESFSVTSYETGVDMKFLENRLGVDVTYYNALNGPQIFTRNVAPSTGFYSRNVNDIITEKNGLEISVTGTPVKTANGFTWDVLANYSTFVERFKEINDPSGKVYLNDHFYKVGDRVDEAFGYNYLRTPEGKIINNAAGLPLQPTQATGSKKSLGFGNSDFFWSLNNNFRYKNLNLSFQFDGRVGGVIYDEIKIDGYQGGRTQDLVEGAYGAARRSEWESFKTTGTTASIVPGYVGEGVRITGGTVKFDAEGNISNYGELTLAENNVPVRLQTYINQMTLFQEPWMISRTYVKLREVVLGYTIPQKMLERTFIKSANISFVARNLLYFAERKDIDLDQYPGYTVFPPLQSATTRRYGVNINLTF